MQQLNKKRIGVWSSESDKEKPGEMLRIKYTPPTKLPF